jgi:hypothetical protein
MEDALTHVMSGDRMIGGIYVLGTDRFRSIKKAASL